MSEEKKPETASKAYKRHGKSEGPIVKFRALIREGDAGDIIGKRGANIKRLRGVYEDATILMPNGKGKERILDIEAKLGSVCDIIFDMMQNISEYKSFKEKEQTDFNCDIHVLVRSSLVGFIIGPKGVRINELKKVSGCSVRMMPHLPGCTEGVLYMKGRLNLLVNCIDRLFMDLEKGPVPRDDFIPFDPTVHPAERFGESFDFIEHRGDAVEEEPTSQNPFNEYYKAGANNSSQQQRPVKRQSTEETSSQPRKKFQCTVPQSVVGFIIGQGGDRISWIRERSQANVKISNPQEGASECIITMIGTDENIEAAQYYLLQAAKEALAIDQVQHNPRRESLGNDYMMHLY